MLEWVWWWAWQHVRWEEMGRWGREGPTNHPPSSVHQLLERDEYHVTWAGDHVTHMEWDWHSSVWWGKIHHMRWRWTEGSHDIL